MTYEEVRARYDYDPAGFLVHKEVNGEFHQHIGQRAGCIGSGGYWYIHHGSKNYGAHRLIWLWHYGVYPKLPDHINRQRADNRIENLRDASSSEQRQNSALAMPNQLGLRGVQYDAKRKNPYRGRAKKEGIAYYSAWVATPEEAHEGYRQLIFKLYGEHGLTT